MSIPPRPLRDSAGTDSTFRKAMRAMPVTRRYEADYLLPNGDIGSMSQLAPAVPMFEQAFAAIGRGTLIATENGPVAVEDLQPGDLLVTSEDNLQPLLWSGRITLYPATTAAPTAGGGQLPEPARLTRILTDAFSLSGPMANIVLGPHARVLRRDARLLDICDSPAAYLPVRALQDGEGVVEITPVAPVVVHHLVMSRHFTLNAGGLEIESFHPGTNLAGMMDPNVLSLFLSLFPHLAACGGGLDGFGAEGFPRLTRFEAEDLLAA